MNEASHELYVSQPALSSSVKELENELGIEIFTRSSQGIALTVDGAEFLTYARQVLDQASLLEERYKNAKPRKQLCSVSTQHYMFAVEAFVEMIDSTKSDEYEFTIRETRTKDIINQVANMLSEIGIIYLSDFNKDVIGKLLRDLKAAGYGVWGLTNWSHETFHFAFEKFPQLAELLQGTVVSGVEKMHKPNADIYELAMSRFGLSPESSVFLDDTAKNVAGARSAGMHAFRFVDADQARRDLESLGVRV